MRIISFIILLFCFTYFNLPIHAEEAKPKKKVEKKTKTQYKYKKLTSVEFSEVELDGAFQKPEGYYNLKAKDTAFYNMIEPKEDFMDELSNSVFNIDEE